MPQYYFAITDNEGSQSPDDAFDLSDDNAAIQQARKTLAEMAVDGLPKDAAHPLAVRVYGPDRDLIAELRLDYSSEIYWSRCKNPPRNPTPGRSR
ncbi:DUF6894 family protein [Mycoplana dimorpha]|uniref:DUF6894 domain-containing protein n=1 Tax=Mycoplana dimorpha TaxID=28320 RepID=A0A2T5BFB8_MYCDI|nr:hypothetical protein [Mycoplana dimorpha]PTM97573.1 hypothetical protein C7449_102447 [Mycoplana dimorpha]